MKSRTAVVLAGALFTIAHLTVPSGADHQSPTLEPPAGPADATIDLATREGVALVRGEWRYSDTRIVEVPFRAPGPDQQPTGAPNTTYDILPHAGRAEFDDSGWARLDPQTLSARRSTGRLCFNWYRIEVTVPERVAGFDTAGATVVFETTVDDYAEVWVDGELPRRAGQAEDRWSGAGTRPTAWSRGSSST